MKTKKKRIQLVGQAVALMVTAGLSVGAANAQNTIRPASKDGALAQTRASRAIDQIAGVVRTPDGKNVKDAAVYWIERSAAGGVQRGATVETDAHGQFRFPEAPPRSGEGRSVTLLVQATGWGLTFQALPLDPSASPPFIITLWPATAVRVPFTDGAGKPLPNVVIRLTMLYVPGVGSLDIPAALHGRCEQKTDAKGDCVFPGLPQGAQVRFAAVSNSYARLRYDDHVIVGKTAVQQASAIQLLPGAIIQGRVTNAANGASIAGIRVGAQGVGSADGWGRSVTDAQGNYRIAGLRPGPYNVALFLQPEQEKDLTARAVEKLDVGPGVTLEHQDFTLVNGSLVKGRVTDKVSGKPIAGAMIGIYGPAHPRSGAGVQNTTTDANGAYQLRVPPGAQYLYVMGLPSNRYERPKKGLDVLVGEGGPLMQDFALSPSLLQNLKPVTGHVVDLDGKPIPKATLSIAPVGDDQFTPRFHEIEADANGAFSLDMTSASVRLRARAGTRATDKITLAQSGDEVTLRLKPNALLTLGGQVISDHAKPLVGAKVTLNEWWLDTGLGGTDAKTDAQGRFKFEGLYPGVRYSVSADAAGYGTLSSEIDEYKPGEKADLPALQLPCADSFVAGRVVDENGDPVARQSVRLSGRTSKFQETLTDKQGRFRFEGVVNEPLGLYLYDDTGFSPRKKAMAADKDVIIIRKAPVTDGVNADEARDKAAHKLQGTLLCQPGPALKAAAWLNTKEEMPAGLKGKIVLIDFWAISCGPCVASLPAVQKVSEQFAGRGVVVVGLHGSMMDKSKLMSFITVHKLTYPIAIDTEDPLQQSFGQIMSGYGVDGIPEVAVLDRQGVVRYLDFGLEGAVKVVGELLANEK